MKQLKILSVVLLVVFLGSLYQGAVLPFLEGLKYGISIANYEEKQDVRTNDFLMLDVKVNNPEYFDTTHVNKLTGERVLIRPSNVSVLVNTMPEEPSWWFAVRVLYGVLLFAVLILGVIIPFLVIKILRSLQNSEVFERINIRRINRIGLMLLVIGLCSTVLQFIQLVSASQMVQLEHFSFSFSRVVDFEALVMGLVILLMNEVLKFSVSMKEDQDLTI